ncbi:hypothetical protein [Halochromatium sp.]
MVLCSILEGLVLNVEQPHRVDGLEREAAFFEDLFECSAVATPLFCRFVSACSWSAARSLLMRSVARSHEHGTGHW